MHADQARMVRVLRKPLRCAKSQAAHLRELCLCQLLRMWLLAACAARAGHVPARAPGGR